MTNLHFSSFNPVVWTVAGSDSCAGAGLQTDLHTFHDFNVVGCSIVTSVTAQHPKGVLHIAKVESETFRQQFEALLIQGFPDAIKIGLLCDEVQAEILAHYLAYIRQHSPKPLFVVYDPVAVASSGQALSESLTLDVVKEKLYPLVDLITPNGMELELLAGFHIAKFADIQTACRRLLDQGLPAVLVKGGHFEWQGAKITDYLVTQDCTFAFHHERLVSVNTHGTGCTFASAISALVAQGFDLPDSVSVATAYLQQGLAEKSGRGQTALCSLHHLGFPTDLHFFPQTELLSAPLNLPHQPFAETEPKLGLYPVVDSLQWLERLLNEGVRTLQIRLKNQPLADIEPQIKTAIELGKNYQARLFINDYWQLAIKYRAYGVHLGQEDLDLADLQAIQQAGLRLGVSTHGYFEILRVLPLKPSYVACGHVFPTQTKAMPSSPQGVQNLARYVRLLNQVLMPSVAIGGIDLNRLPAVLQTGVGSIAVVSAITQADDWQQAVVTFQKCVK